MQKTRHGAGLGGFMDPVALAAICAFIGVMAPKAWVAGINAWQRRQEQKQLKKLLNSASSKQSN
jgi:hypothetical protein